MIDESEFGDRCSAGLTASSTPAEWLGGGRGGEETITVADIRRGVRGLVGLEMAV